jgi:hypothetical protein
MQSGDVRGSLTGVRPGGCAQIDLEEFATELIASGYAVLSARDYVRSAAHLGRWMDAGGIDLDQLRDEVIGRFARHRCGCSGSSRHGRRPSQRYVARAERFVRHLRSRGRVSAGTEGRPRAVPAPLVGFRAWMTRHRGATQRTVPTRPIEPGEERPAPPQERRPEKLLGCFGAVNTGWHAGCTSAANGSTQQRPRGGGVECERCVGAPWFLLGFC